jgi:hypothetical protein
MKIIESMKENKEMIMTGFWAGIGFWAASRIIRYIDMFIREYLMEGF